MIPVDYNEYVKTWKQLWISVMGRDWKISKEQNKNILECMKGAFGRGSENEKSTESWELFRVWLNGCDQNTNRNMDSTSCSETISE